MRDLMRKFSPEATIDEIEAVCDALDSDGGGDISFEEFFDFTQKLTFHMVLTQRPFPNFKLRRWRLHETAPPRWRIHDHMRVDASRE